MEMAYLGLFSKIFNWVLDRIFGPIFKWLTNLLTTIFTWIFNEILAPILLPILETVLDFAIELIKDIYAVHMYAMFSSVLKLIDYLEAAFDIFIGVKPVTYDGGPGNKITGSLLEVLLQQETINTIFWILTFAGLAIAMILTIYSVAKSSFDLDFENKRPVSKVLTAMMKTFVQFFMVPFFVYFIVKLAAVILQGITYLLNQGQNTTLGRIIFMIASLDAAKNAAYNISTKTSNTILGTTSADIVRYPFYSLTAANAKDYGDISAVMSDFDLSNFDYLIGGIAAIFLFFTLAVCLIKFVQRIFEVILLYIVSPYFVSTIPLDDGEKFGRWREMFVGKCFSGFGSAIGMRLYLLVCPMIMSGDIDFGASAEMDYMMKLFFLAGGAWAVFKSGPMITNLISFQAGQDETMTQAAAGGFLYAQTAGRMGRAVSSALHGKGASQAGARKGKGDDKADQRFKDAKPQLSAQKTTPWKAAKPSGPRSGSPLAGAHRSGAAKRGVKPSGPRTGGMTIGGNRGSAAGSAGWRTANKPSGQRTGSVTIGAHREKPPVKAHSSFKLGSLFQSTYDDKGNHKVRVMGFGYTSDAEGKTTSMKFPGMKLQKDDSGSYHVSKFHMPGVVNVKGNVENGSVKYSDISVLGMNYHRGTDGSRSFHAGSIGVDRGADGSRSYHVGSVGVDRGADGSRSYHAGSVGVDRGADGSRSYHAGSVGVDRHADGSRSYYVASKDQGAGGSTTYRAGNGTTAPQTDGNHSYHEERNRGDSSSAGSNDSVRTHNRISIHTAPGQHRPNEIKIGSLHYKRGGSITKTPKTGGDKA